MTEASEREAEASAEAVLAEPAWGMEMATPAETALAEAASAELVSATEEVA